MKTFLNLNANFISNQNLFIVAGLGLKLYNTNLSLVDEFDRNTKDNSIKLMCSIKKDRFVLATNSDVEVYTLAIRNNSYIMKLFQKTKNAHKDSILCLDSVSGELFASGSSDGHLILWNSESLATMHLRPFDELNKNETALRLSSTSIISFKLVNQVELRKSSHLLALFT
jgi:WD40 repeat protein